MIKHIATIVGCAALGAASLVGCGSSTKKAPGVQLAPSAGMTRSTQTTAKVPLALSKGPKVTVPKRPPPKRLVVKDLVKGTGQPASAGQPITVNYVGVLYKTGKQFDSSWKTGKPVSLTLRQGPGGVISGWVKGIPGMRVGGRRELIIPPGLAYGKAGRSPAVPPDSTLVFVIDLLSVG